MTFEAKIIHSVELDAWLPNYPGDPLVRDACYSLCFKTNSVEELDEWLKSICQNRVDHIKTESCFVIQHGYTMQEDPNSWIVVYNFEDKRDLMLVKLGCS